ncbi:MAG: hypothetical protein PHG49_00735, partial [Candidatus Pacebacteria bacterium]|nr:hypothetical protein [Candidatus Paceibacterota bacterium]
GEFVDYSLEDKDEINIQTVTIGDEEEIKSTGEKYLIVVVPTVDKKLFDKYVVEREKEYDIKVVSLQENGVKNNFQEVSTFIKNMYNEFPYTYLAFHEKIKIGEEIIR